MRSDNPKNNKNVMDSLKNNKNVATPKRRHPHPNQNKAMPTEEQYRAAGRLTNPNAGGDCLAAPCSRCIVHGCVNHRHQGRFVGDMCAPCHSYITTGKVGPTTSFLSRMDVLRTIAVSDWKTAGELRKMARDAISSENTNVRCGD